MMSYGEENLFKSNETRLFMSMQYTRLIKTTTTITKQMDESSVYNCFRLTIVFLFRCKYFFVFFYLDDKNNYLFNYYCANRSIAIPSFFMLK